METKEIRLRNLLALAGEYKRNAEFSEKLGMNPTYFSQIKTGRKAVGDELARRIEKTLGLPRGYLDTPKTAGAAGIETGAGQIPAETLGVAYALETLSPRVRESICRMIYSLAAEASEHRLNQQETVVGPFTIKIGEEADGRDSSVQKKEASR